jgi:hypothetical protein
VELVGEGAAEVEMEAWLTGYEPRTLQAAASATQPAPGPLLPPHPYGFSRALRL